MLAALDRQIAAGLGRGDPRYVPHPASWLNAGRWLDEPDPTLEERCLRAAGLDRQGRALPDAGASAAELALAALDDPAPVAQWAPTAGASDRPPDAGPRPRATERRDGDRPLGSLVLPLLSIYRGRAA